MKLFGNRGVFARPWFLLLFVLVVGLAQSQEQQKTTPHESGTDRRAAAIKKPKSDAKKPAAKRADAHTEEKLEIDRRLAEYTRQLAVYTGELSNYTFEVSRYTFWLFIATLVLGVLSLLQAALFFKEFTSTHPPKMVVRRFQLTMPEEGRRPIVELIVANDGMTSAIIGEHSFTALVLTTENLETFEKRSYPPYTRGASVLRKVYKPHFRLAHNLHLEGFKDEVAAFNAVKEGTAKLVCFGFIYYRDRMWGRYETRFYRTYEMGAPFLVPSDDPDYDDSGKRIRR